MCIYPRPAKIAYKSTDRVCYLSLWNHLRGRLHSTGYHAVILVRLVERSIGVKSWHVHLASPLGSFIAKSTFAPHVCTVIGWSPNSQRRFCSNSRRIHFM